MKKTVGHIFTTAAGNLTPLSGRINSVDPQVPSSWSEPERKKNGNSGADDRDGVPRGFQRNRLRAGRAAVPPATSQAEQWCTGLRPRAPRRMWSTSSPTSAEPGWGNGRAAWNKRPRFTGSSTVAMTDGPEDDVLVLAVNHQASTASTWVAEKASRRYPRRPRRDEPQGPLGSPVG